MSHELAAQYGRATVVEHDGGHLVPSPNAYKNEIGEFLQPFLMQR